MKMQIRFEFSLQAIDNFLNLHPAGQLQDYVQQEIAAFGFFRDVFALLVIDGISSSLYKSWSNRPSYAQRICCLFHCDTDQKLPLGTYWLGEEAITGDSDK